VIIFTAQLEQFKIIVDGELTWMTGQPLIIMAGLTALTIVLVVLFPKITKAVPPSLAAIIVVFFIVLVFNIDTRTVRDIASVSGGFPPFHLPDVPFSVDTLKVIFPYSLIM